MTSLKRCLLWLFKKSECHAPGHTWGGCSASEARPPTTTTDGDELMLTISVSQELTGRSWGPAAQAVAMHHALFARVAVPAARGAYL